MMDMSWHLYAVLGLLIAAVYGLPRLVNALLPKPPAPPELIPVHLFGGPHHDTTQQIRADEKPQFFIAQYLPVDEETGEPKEENLIKADEQKMYFKPSYAYYQAITDNDYFYVRDITAQEIYTMQKTGKLPSPQPEE
jgi:hypothetical protein